jgi:hypothetical protein
MIAEQGAHRHTEFFIISVVLPFLFVIVMNMIEGLVEPFTWRTRLIKVSWDNCVLAIGIIAGIFANADVMKSHGGGWPVIETSIGVCLSLGTALGIVYVRRSIIGASHVAGWKVLLCVALSGSAIAFPSYIAFTY